MCSRAKIRSLSRPLPPSLRRTKARLPRAPGWFRSIVEQAIAGVYVVRDNRFLYVNPRMAELFGYTVEEMLSMRDVSGVVAPGDRERVRRNLALRQSGELASLHYAFQGQRRDGSSIDVEVHGTRVELDGVPAVMGLLVDVSGRVELERERLRLLREAREALRARDETLAVVSHDLRNPLNAIGMTVDLLLDGVVASRDADAMLLRIKRLAGSMSALIQDLLDISTMESERLPIRIQPADGQGLLREAADRLMPLLEEKRVQLELETAEPAPVLADPERILRVISNLVGNALKFVPEGGRIALGARPQNETVQFTVADDGPGIDNDDLPHLFERFWKGHGSRGSGLGLAIAQGIVEAHGGRIWVESCQGKGSTFHFTLPKAAVSHPSSLIGPEQSSG